MERKKARLIDLGFVLLPGGEAQMGTRHPTPCRLEVYRRNEVTVDREPRMHPVDPFWICKFTVTNADYERMSRRKKRPPSSMGDMHPATEVTYLNALSYAEWLSKREGIRFDLPTEPQWVYAAAPQGWHYPYQRGHKDPSRERVIIFDPDRQYGAVPVDDPTDVNCWGLHHMGGNVMQFTKGTYYTPGGPFGYSTNGMYCIVRGGDFGHCPLSASIHTRVMMDVSHRDTRVGLRLVCNELTE